MANLTPAIPEIAGAVSAFAASTPAGDAVVYSGGDILVEFRNTHTLAVTINFAPTKTTGHVPGAGKVTIPTRTFALAAAADAAFYFKRSEISAYIDANGRLPITYTGGHADLLVRALRIE